MKNRRGALIAIAVSALGGVAWFIAGGRWRSRTRGANIFSAFGAQPIDSGVDAAGRLGADLDRLAGRVYSEEGIPMFLACENLAPKARPRGTSTTLPALNKDLSAAFGRDAAAWQQMHPDAPVTDVAKILEMLADRDFANGGAEGKL